MLFPVLFPAVSPLPLLLLLPPLELEEPPVTVTFVLAAVMVPPASLPSASPTTVQYALIEHVPAAFAVNENDCDVGYPAASPIFATPSPPLLSTPSSELEITTVPKYPDGMETVTLTVFPTATELELTLSPSPWAYTCSAGAKTSITAITSDNIHPNNFLIFFLTFLILRYL